MGEGVRCVLHAVFVVDFPVECCEVPMREGVEGVLHHTFVVILSYEAFLVPFVATNFWSVILLTSV